MSEFIAACPEDVRWILSKVSSIVSSGMSAYASISFWMSFEELVLAILASLSMDISEGPSGLLQAADMVMRVKAIRSMRKFEVIAA